MSRAFGCAVLAVAFTGCGDTPSPEAPTQILVAIDSDYRIGTELVRVLLETERFDGVRRSASLTLTPNPRKTDETDIPFSFGVPAREQDIGREIGITVSGFGPADSDLRIRHAVRTGFRRGKSLLLAIGLARDCENRFAACEEEGQRCVDDGPCVSTTVDPSSLPVVEPGRELDEFSLFDGPLRPTDGGAPDSKVPFPMTDAGADRRGPDGAKLTACAAPPCDSGPPRCEGGECRQNDASLDACRDGRCFDTPKPAEAGVCEAGACEAGRQSSDAREAGCVGDGCAPDSGLARDDDSGSGDAGDASCDGRVCGVERCAVNAAWCSDGTLQRCDDEGYWQAERSCFSGCDAAVEAACQACAVGDRACGLRAVLTCSGDGTADVERCYFACWGPTVECLERTALGQALITTVL